MRYLSRSLPLSRSVNGSTFSRARYGLHAQDRLSIRSPMLRKQTGLQANHVLGLERENHWQWAYFSTRSPLRALDLVGKEVLPVDHGFGNRS